MAAAGYTWYWDNDGVWTPYSEELQNIIEAARLRGDPQAHLPIGSSIYIIDFHESVQESPVGNRRRISRRITGNAGNKRIAEASENTLWFWRDDDGVTWKPYDTALSQRLTQARLEGDIEVYLEIRETLYQVDMARNLQINMITGYGRDIRQKQLFQKVVFLGHNCNGSTTKIAQQMIKGGSNNDNANTNASTALGNYDTAAPDVNINVWHPALHPELSVQIWEFIGRHALYPYESIFFTSQTLFVIVWELDGDDAQLQQQSNQAMEKEIRDKVQFWINLIEERVPDNAVIIPVICAQDNDSNGGNVTETEIRRRCKRLRRHLIASHSIIQFCDDPENPVVHVRLPATPSPISNELDILQSAVLGSLIANPMPLASIDVTLQTAIRSKRENGMKLADVDSLETDLPAVSLLANSGECMVFPTLLPPFANWVVLDVPWFYRLGGCILLHNWLALIGDGRRRDCRGEPPAFAGAMPENCPNLHKEDARMLWQNSLDASNYSAQEHSELTGTNNTILDYLPVLLVHFGVLVPIDVYPVAVGDNGGDKGQDNNTLLTTVPFYMPSLGIIHPSTSFVDANLFCVPSLLEGGVQGDNNLAEYRNASGSANTFVAQKVEFASDIPSTLMGTIIASLLRNILSATNDSTTVHVLSVKTAYCWRSMFRIKFSLALGNHRQTILEVCSQIVELVEGGKAVKSYLFTNANEIRGDGGRHIWEAGFGLVCDTIQDVMSRYRDLAYTREAFCHECLVADGLHGAPSWGWNELEDALRGEQESLRCPKGHLALASLTDQQELNLKRAVVLIGLYDASKKSGKIQRLGSGVVVDAIRGLIVTAARNVMNIEGNERFGQNYDGIVGGKIVVGVIPENGGEAVFRYFAKIRAKDPALASSKITHVDACVLRISSRFENDVRGNGDGCSDEIEMLVRGTVRGLVQLPTQSQWEVEDPVRIFGYDQGNNGVRRRVSHVCGQICQYREAEANDVTYSYQPLRTVVVRTETNHGYVGGPCINKDGKVVGILSCADPDEQSRSCVVPVAEWQPLLQTVP